MSRAVDLLAPDRALLLPQFETYRLQSLDQDRDVAAYPLPGAGATQSRVGYGAQQLGFKEMRSRISWDHLDTAGSRGVYIDTDWNVVGFELDAQLQPVFTQLASLPAPISSTPQQAEYPRALPLSATTWAISSGSGSLYILRVNEPGSGAFTGTFVARYDLLDNGEGEPVPFLLFSSHHVGGDVFRLLVAKAVVKPAEGSKYKAREATFELSEVEVDAAHANAGDTAPEALTPRWTMYGTDLPYWATWSEGGWVVLSEDAFTNIKPGDHHETEAERVERERKEKIAKLGLGATLAEGSGAAESDTKQRTTEAAAGTGEDADEVMDVDETDDDDTEYPFSWTQDAQSVSITFQLPPGTPRNALKVSLAPEVFMLAVDAASLPAPLSPALVKFTSLPFASLWTEITADESTWTYDAAKGTLEVELQKGEGNPRWPSVFIPDEDDCVPDVPETFSAATLAAMRQSFSQANTVRTRGDDEPQGNHPTMPALLREEMDFDDGYDADYGQRTEGAFADLTVGSVGRSVLVGHIVADDGNDEPASARMTGYTPTATWSRQPTSVLSLPLTSAGDLAPDTGIIVRSAVDGLLFAPGPGTDPAQDPWRHLGTNPALAFVMSSKRDLRLVRHVTRPGAQGPGAGGAPAASTVFALDAGSGQGFGNAYIYYPPAEGEAASATSARQGVVGVSGGDRGALLGVGQVAVGTQTVVVALCEKALVVLRVVL